MSQQQPGNPPPSLQPTHVVTCLLMRFDEREPRLLLVRRSSRVGSYHGRWAGVSGFVEIDATPEEQAYTEIREETGLQREQVRMLKRGVVVEHIDAELGRHFYIHPFLFEVLTPNAIRIDWEATEMHWVAPSQLLNYETVPKHETVPKLPEVYESAVNGEEVIS